MSKGGGAGKVYFVLYLAVVLELLIIIVERDEAEEHLHRKTQEAMRIVESILSQLQSGAGTEGINTRPQDEILIPPPGINIKEAIGAELKPNRQYTVEVGVTDISTSINRREGESEKDYVLRLKKLVELANVEELQYQIFFNPDPNPIAVPPFPSSQYIKEKGIDIKKFTPGQMLTHDSVPGVQWEFLGMQELILDKDATYNNIDLKNVSVDQVVPIYPNEKKVTIGSIYAPPNSPQDSIFFYNKESLSRLYGTQLQKRSFKVNFQPPSRAGWYKLRFASRTNRILGVKADVKSFEDLKDDATVNIGTVTLTVNDLKKVKKELGATLEKFTLPTIESLISGGDILLFDRQLKEAIERAKTDEKADEIVGKINLYGYICKLLAPGQSINFDQNAGSLEYNVRVTTPKPPISDPIIASLDPAIYTFKTAPAVFGFEIGPWLGTNTVSGNVTQNGSIVAQIQFNKLDANPANGSKVKYTGTVNQDLTPGEYEITVTHNLMGKPKSETTKLEVFDRKLTTQNEKLVKGQLSAYSYYGYAFTVNLDPMSGGKIKSNQFQIQLYENGATTPKVFNGLSMRPEDKYYFTPELSNVGFRLVWNQPYTNQQVELFKDQIEVKQDEPSFNLSKQQVEYTGTASKFKIRVSGIGVNRPTASQTEQANVKVTSGGDPKKIDGLAGYNFSTEPLVDGDENSGYTIELELNGKLERGESTVRGSIDIPIRGVAINPKNGKVSQPSTKMVRVNVEYSPDRGGPKRPGGRR